MDLPKHIAIIMDGNGRWAKKRKLPHIMGHRSGVKATNTIVETCARKGIKALTLFTFSTENWKRPKEEVNALMDMLLEMVSKNAKKVTSNNIRFNIIGQIDGLPEKLSKELLALKDKTADNSGMILTLALNYGGRQEILDAVKAVCKKTKEEGLDVGAWQEKDFESYLYTNDLPDLDMVIRTSDEKRISNFLLWQAAYAEFYFTETLWPDFDAEELEKALTEYDKRERRYGGRTTA